MSSISGNLVPEALAGNDSNLIADPLVDLEVEAELGVVSLNDDLGGLLDGLGSNATHVGGVCEGIDGVEGWMVVEEVVAGAVSTESLSAKL